MMNKKYFFFDIDGTLTDKRTGKLVESARLTIQKLQENGHFVAIATGRAHYKTIDIAKKAGIHHIVSNGGAALTINDQLVDNRALDHELAVALCQEIDELGYGYLISYEDSQNVYMFDDRFILQMGYRLEPTRYIIRRDMNYKDVKDIYKIYVSIPHDKENQLTLKDTLGHIRFLGDYLIFQHDEKDKGIERMMEKIGGSLDDVVVFGDDYNDLVMFKDCWTSIAMGNACQELKDKATFVTRCSYEDGIEYACHHMGWI